MNRPATTLSSRTYLALAGLAAILGLAAAWLYVALLPMAFLDSAYPVWRLKQARLADCALGDVLIVGDSQVEAAVVVTDLDTPTWNLGFGGASPIETYHVVQQALRCPHPPKLVLYTHGISVFSEIGESLWKHAARFGMLDYGDLREIAATADRLHDRSIIDRDLGDGLRGAARDAAYTARFPSVFVGSLLEGNFFRRLSHNQEVLEQAVRGRGSMPYLRPPGPMLPAPETTTQRFDPKPVVVHYFRRTLAMLAAAGVRTVFLPTPVPAETVAKINQDLRAAFAALIAQEITQQRGAAAIGGNLFEPWPNRYFADAHHLAPDGAALFTSLLAPCLNGWREWAAADAPFRVCNFSYPAMARTDPPP